LSKNEIRKQVALAVSAAQDKKAEDISILKLDPNSSAFTDYFIVLSGTNPRQIQAISDEIELRLKRTYGMYVTHSEGYQQAEWVLLDYVDFVVHIFSEKARKYYELERLWKSAKKLTPAELALPEKAAPKKAAAKTVGKKATAGKKPAARKSAAKKSSARATATRSSRKVTKTKSKSGLASRMGKNSSGKRKR
jgi:ribosome-associated protein